MVPTISSQCSNLENALEIKFKKMLKEMEDKLYKNIVAAFNNIFKENMQNLTKDLGIFQENMKVQHDRSVFEKL